jgi:hypothetical protein
MITSINEYRKLFENVQDRINVSCAALASINIDGKFLLIREDEKFQPIGGGLRYDDSAIDFLNSINYETSRTDNDIRINIPKSNWNKFKTWFESGIDRETTIDREIDEEVGMYIDSSILGQLDTKNYSNIEVIGDKYRIFQIHKVSMTDDIKQHFIDLMLINENFQLFTKEEIMSTRRDIIAGHCQYIVI